MHDGRRSIAIAAAVVVLFGLLTVASGGRALFGSPEARAAVGNAVPFVLWFNFLAGFGYVAAGIGLFQRKSWAVMLSIAIHVATVLVLAGFAVHVMLGGAFEMRTVWAMSLRTIIWATVVGVATGASADAGPGGGDDRS